MAEQGIFNNLIKSMECFLEGDFKLKQHELSTFTNNDGNEVNYAWAKLSTGEDSFVVSVPANNYDLEKADVNNWYHCYFSVGEKNKKIYLIGLKPMERK